MSNVPRQIQRGRKWIVIRRGGWVAARRWDDGRESGGGRTTLRPSQRVGVQCGPHSANLQQGAAPPTSGSLLAQGTHPKPSPTWLHDPHHLAALCPGYTTACAQLSWEHAGALPHVPGCCPGHLGARSAPQGASPPSRITPLSGPSPLSRGLCSTRRPSACSPYGSPPPPGPVCPAGLLCRCRTGRGSGLTPATGTHRRTAPKRGAICGRPSVVP